MHILNSSEYASNIYQEKLKNQVLQSAVYVLYGMMTIIYFSAFSSHSLLFLWSDSHEEWQSSFFNFVDA